MGKASTLIIVAVTMLATSPAAMAEGDVTRGKDLYAACQDCHGENGEGNHELDAPSLAGQHDVYLLSQIEKFRSGARGQHPEDTFGQIMTEQARTLADDQAVEDVVAFISTLEASQPARTELTGDPERGGEAYSICGFCHGTKAQGLLTDTPGGYPTPRLTAQHDWYLIRQIEHFKDKVRGIGDEDKSGREMRVGILPLQKGQDVRDIVAYIMTLQ